MAEQRVIGMATFPPRRAGMQLVVNALLPQCDKFYLYLNGYTARPAELPSDPRLICFLAGPGCDLPDLSSNGKFHMLGVDDGYYLLI